jgi:TolB-like protein
MDQQLRRGFMIGVLEIEPLTGRIASPNGETHVQPKVMDVLVFLAQHAGELVERETLLDQVWGRVTSEEVLTRCISELRTALGDDRGSPRYIQTVPKRGYRLLERAVEKSGAASERAPRPTTAQPAAARAPAHPPAPSAAMASIAVLPFDIHSAEPKHQFLGDAFAAELQSTLARVDRLSVASRRSSLAFKNTAADMREIGAKLNVDYVITGSIRGNGQSVRVVAELNDTLSGMQVWAESYDRSSDDLLAVEKEIAAAIVGSFTAVRLRDELASVRHKPAANLDAWGLTQKARALALDYTPTAFHQAIELARRAIDLDANYAVAHGVLAALLVETLVNGTSAMPAEDEAAATAAARTALALAPQDPLLLKMVSLVFTYCGDPHKAIACLRKAVQYAPFDFGAWGYMGWPLTSTGDPKDREELRTIIDRLLAIVPQHPGASFWHYHKSVAETCDGEFSRARESVETALDLRAFALGCMHYANVLGHLGAKKEAAQAVQRARDLNPGMTARHYESLVKKLTVDDVVIDRRVGGLKVIATAGR